MRFPFSSLSSKWARSSIGRSLSRSRSRSWSRSRSKSRMFSLSSDSDDNDGGIPRSQRNQRRKSSMSYSPGSRPSYDRYGFPRYEPGYDPSYSPGPSLGYNKYDPPGYGHGYAYDDYGYDYPARRRDNAYFERDPADYYPPPRPVMSGGLLRRRSSDKKVRFSDTARVNLF